MSKNVTYFSKSPKLTHKHTHTYLSCFFCKTNSSTQGFLTYVINDRKDLAFDSRTRKCWTSHWNPVYGLGKTINWKEHLGQLMCTVKKSVRSQFKSCSSLPCIEVVLWWVVVEFLYSKDQLLSIGTGVTFRLKRGVFVVCFNGKLIP